jgi:phosphoglycolate phosphatase-like HAD superfamily hydrolase
MCHGSRAMRAAIFDFDGTIADSLEQAITAYNQLAPRYRIKPITREGLPRLRTLSPRAALREHGVTFWNLPWIVRSMRNALHEHVDALEAFPGMPDMLRTLSARGFRLGILSTNSTRNIQRFLARTELEVFEHVSGGSSLLGKARALRRLLKRVKLDAGAVTYVGDEVRDIDAARAVGVRSVAVSWGYADRTALLAHQPEHLVDRPEELLALLIGS